ncbi:PLP-dependent cysteine synthase family protein [Saliterribacillus persicus]|uniref:cysteine synthase n=1 Tax=Saliterribacillus persicus TaxID=930114 RepID=A0A368YE26_9BACI|nr:cysteine synthase family protein [Saliterribacillus persicus]RCW77137.1 cystathionine beta-synthase (acetylserine-dependent) [Saliterribacillus persicus]
MSVISNVQDLIGHTPLFEISHIKIPNNVRILAKLEYFNPGGSIKDRLGKAFIEEAIATRELLPGGTIIEPTAGNTGIGIAIAAINKGFNVIFCVPDHFSSEKQQLMKALGAEIVSTPREAGMKGAIEKAEELLKVIPNSFSPRQFSNIANPNAYMKTVAPEIWNELDGKLSTFVAGAGTGGTFMGCARYFKEKNKQIKTVIVEPEGSIIAGGEAGPHRTEGIGMEFLPSYMDKSYFDSIQTISDQDAFYMVGQLARKEGLLVGSSSGSALCGALKEAEIAEEGTTIVTIFPDGSDRYLSKNIYS